MQLLTDDFLALFPDQPSHMNELGSFVFYRTYSRWLPEANRRETWKETCRRSIEYNVGLAIKQYKKNKLRVPYERLRTEAQDFFDRMFNLRQFLSGRTMWVGGGEGGVAEKYPLANFNCSFLNIMKWEDMGDLFYLLMVGTGVGFKITKEMARGLAPIRNNVEVIHSEYRPLDAQERLEHTRFDDLGNGYAKIYVGDSKEGWVEALKWYFNVHTYSCHEHVHTLKISYNSVRPKGERLKTFGGTASGYEPLKEMFDGFSKVIKNQIDENLEPLSELYIQVSDGTRIGFTDIPSGYVQVRPIHILDMANLVGNNVVVGGVRRTAEIALFDADDWECILAKYGINGVWDEDAHKKVIEAMEGAHVSVPEWLRHFPIGDADARPLHHRRMSNNSIAFTDKPNRSLLHLIYTIMKGEGEPGFVNIRELARRRFIALGVNPESVTEEEYQTMMFWIGMNPCAEIDLWTYGVCNLTTINVKNFVVWSDAKKRYILDNTSLYESQRLSARAGLRMTLVTLEIPHWNETQERDRLLGTSVTGWKDAMAMIGASEQEEAWILQDLRTIAREEADRYAKEMRIPSPLLVTTVKPEGTLSQVAGGVSSGLHWSHSPYYIRRIRINAQDPLAKVAMFLGWTVNPEVGTQGADYAEQMQNARTLVIDFPVDSGATETKDDITALQQLETYKRFQRNYSEHNTSNTITVKPDEWGDVEAWVFENWDEFAAVSFLAHSGGSYALAPYESITKETYDELRAKMKPFDKEILQAFESTGLSDLEGADGCDNGICPVR